LWYSFQELAVWAPEGKVLAPAWGLASVLAWGLASVPALVLASVPASGLASAQAQAQVWGKVALDQVPALMLVLEPELCPAPNRPRAALAEDLQQFAMRPTDQ